MGRGGSSKNMKDVIDDIKLFKSLHQKKIQNKLTEEDKDRWETLKRKLEFDLYGQNYDKESDRREDIRIHNGWKAKYRIGDEILIDQAENISSGGIFLKTKEPPPKETIINLILFFDDIEKGIEVNAKVVWSIPKNGMGLKFIDLDKEKQDKINKLIYEMLEKTALTKKNK